MLLVSRFLRIVVAGLLLYPAAALADTKVVVTSKPIHALVSSIMAGIGNPDLLIEGQASPHSYALKPSDARKVHNAQVFFRVSEELEPFTSKLVDALPKSVRVVSLVEAPGLKLLKRREGGAFESEGGHEHHEHTYDPHVWLDPDNATAMIRFIADVLSELDPANAAAMKTNATAEIERVDALLKAISTELAPVSEKPFVVYHDAYQYFEKRFGLTAVGSITVSPDLPPSGKRLRNLREKIVATGAMCVFAEPQLDPRVTEVIVEGTRARVGTLDPEGTKLAAGPDLYRQLMRNLAQGFRDCLGAN